jgi:50S ribosomal subunit-associated GTPase HflX
MTSINTFINRYGACKKQIKVKKDYIRQVLQEIEFLENQMATLKNTIDQMTRTPQLSEHAKIRYMTRFWNLDLTPIEAEILTPENIEKIKQRINGELATTTSKGRPIILVLRNNVVSTVKYLDYNQEK